MREVIPQRMDRGAPLFGPDFLDILGRLHLVARKILSGRMKAERRSKRKGVSVEFADHRPYAPGDDFRFIDWNVFFRTEQLFLKLFEEQEDLHVYVLVDCSASMDFGTPYKFHYARRLAAAIGYLGLAGLDRIEILPFSTALPKGFGSTLSARGKGKVFRVLEFLDGLEPAGETDLHGTIQALGSSKRKRGLAVVISDLFDRRGAMPALDALRYHKFEPYVIQVVSPQEAQPDLLGDLRILDSESGGSRDVTVTEGMLRRYRAAFTEYCASVETNCRRREIGYARCLTDVPFEDSIIAMLRHGGLFQ